MRYMITIIVIVLILGVGLTLNGLKKGKKLDEIKEFEFYYTNGTSYNSDVHYKIKCDDKCTVTIKKSGVSKENAKAILLTKDKVEKIKEISNKYDISKWNGFQKTNNNALDGDTFLLNITTEKGIKINASGYMKWPKNYNEFKKEIDIYFEELNNLSMEELYGIKFNNGGEN